MSKFKEHFYRKISLYAKQNWLLNKKEELDYLVKFCDTDSQKELLFDLLHNFNYLNDDTYQMILNEITDYIINTCEYCDETTQIVALTKSEAADSGQVVLYHLRNSIWGEGWRRFKTVNKLGSASKTYRSGFNQIILFDEFIGSGQTLINRINEFRNLIDGEYTFKCCFIAGMEDAVSMMEERGIEVFCPLQFHRGISDNYQGAMLRSAEDNMLNLELKLSPWVNDKELYKYSFGWGRAESLYSLEGCHGNTPNNVFPVFWWPQDIKGKTRKNLLNRTEEGF